MERDAAIIESLNDLSIVRERLLQFTRWGVYRRGNPYDQLLEAAIDKLIEVSDDLLESVENDELLEGN